MLGRALIVTDDAEVEVCAGRFSHMPGAHLVLPTYNEAANLERFVAAVLPRLAEGRPDARVLVVDDDSPDGTGELADALAARDPRIAVLHNGPKRGLGRAYVAGFRRALADGADLVVQMDADFSHDPADIPRLIAAADDADLVIGSRYVEGGGVTDWGLARRALSRGGSVYARAMLGLGVRDLTGGFKCFRRRALESIDLDALRASGYVFQIETTYRAVQAGQRVAEVPIVFRDRQAGASKMTTAVAVEAMWQVPAMRLRAPRPAAEPVLSPVAR
jgi:dolichol-phosphate mannosyltransferase